MRKFKSMRAILFCAVAIFSICAISYAQDESLKEVNMLALYEIIDANEGKVVVVNLWSTKCKGCIRELPTLIGLRDKYSEEDVKIIGVSFDRDGLKILPRFIIENNINYSIYCAANDYSIINEYGITVIPTTIIYDKAGDKAAEARGVASEETFVEEIDKLLKE